jgi:DNA polymerase V
MSSTKRVRYFLIDCNQFFVSCEQVFAPGLRGKPVVVLSSNDGIIVARSKEAKALGIPMGAPAFQYQELFAREKVRALSSNFALYSDMSHRVMRVLSLYAEELEEYSIDEAFLKSDTLTVADAIEIRRRVAQWTGIPVSIGIGQTKTLAKLASDLAKKREDGVFAFEEQIDAHLDRVPVKEVWGVGAQLSTQLRAYGIDTVLALKQAPDDWIKKQFSVTLLKTVWELRGIPCLSLEVVDTTRKSITCSRSFGTPVTTLDTLHEALSHYTASAAETLRAEGLMACVATVFLMTSMHRPPCYTNQALCTWEEPTHYTPFLIAKAKNGLTSIYRSGYLYKKVGITLAGIVPADCYQRDFFHARGQDLDKRAKALAAHDAINQRFGADTLFFAAEGTSRRYKPKRENVSPRFTTSWDELLKVC